MYLSQPDRQESPVKPKELELWREEKVLKSFKTAAECPDFSPGQVSSHYFTVKLCSVTAVDYSAFFFPI